MTKYITKCYTGESYKCCRCQIEYGDKSPSDNWTCPVCKKKLSIYIDYNGRKNDIERKLPSEIKKGDLVLLPFGDYTGNMVLNISKIDYSYKIALKGHGVITVSDNEFLNCITGAWK